MNNCKCILFDYDGTLTDRTRSSYENYQILFSEFFPDLHDNLEMEARIQQCLLWDEYGTIRKAEVMERIQKKWKPDLDIDKAVKRWYEIFPDHQVWTEGMKEAILKLKENYHVGLVTNGPHDRQWPKIKKMHLEDIFEVILVSEDFGKKKPDPSIYHAAADLLHVPYEQCAYVGDTFSTDIKGAILSGMIPVWYCGERSGVTDRKDVMIVHSSKELLDLFA